MKTCFKCGKAKTIDQFYVHKEMADGHLGKCIPCTKRDVKERYRDPVAILRIAEYENRRNKSPERRAAKLCYQRVSRLKNPGKHKARRKIMYAIRSGKIIRNPCEICGDSKSEAHHTDYRKPLQVIWLCFQHHREEEGKRIISRI